MLPQQLIDDGVLWNYQSLSDAKTAIMKALKCQRSYAYDLLHVLERAGWIELHPARISINHPQFLTESAREELREGFRANTFHPRPKGPVRQEHVKEWVAAQEKST